MKKYLLIFLASVILFSCSNSRKAEIDKLKEEVMAAHDEVMPKMSELMKAQKMLKTKADSLIQAADSLSAQTYLEAAEKIDSANEGMMNWMRNFEVDFKGTEEEVFKYLQQQKVAIDKVKEDMIQSFEEGKKKL